MNEPQASEHDYTGVLALLDAYFEGLWRADPERLRDVFSESARYATAAFGDLLELGMDEYLPRVGERTPPNEEGAPRAYEVDGITFAGPGAAVAHLRCSLFGYDYTDILVMLRIEGRWRIQSKVFHAVPVPPSAPIAAE